MRGQVPLARWVCAMMAAALLAVQPTTGAAEQRGRGAGSSGRPASQVRQAPPVQPATGQAGSPAPRFRSTLKFDPRLDARPLASPFGGRTPRSLGLYPYAVWPYYDYDSGPGLLADGQTVMPPAPPGFPVGGLQLDVQPWRSEVWVDGAFAGKVGDFTGYYQPLELPAGDHVIEILAENYNPLIFYITISPGVTSTYRGTLERAAGY
jgi:hypothetical protein